MSNSSHTETVRDAKALIAGLIFGPIGFLLMGIGVGSHSLALRWVLIPIGTFLLVRFVPPAVRVRFRELREKVDDLDAFLDAPKRLPCPCCRQPTLEPDVQDQSCVLCEWPVTGSPESDDQSSGDVRTGRDNFRRHLSVYPPQTRPAWSPDPPSPQELEVRRSLLVQYSKIRSAPRAALLDAWDAAKQLEGQLRSWEHDRAES